MVCNLHITTGTISEFSIWNIRAFQKGKTLPVSWQDENLFLYCPGRGANPRPPANPNFIANKNSHIIHFVLGRPSGGFANPHDLETSVEHSILNAVFSYSGLYK